MAYVIHRSDPDADKITVADGSINTTSTSIGLVGRNVLGYGQTIATTQLQILENFANDSEPATPIRGQLWYDTSDGVNALKVSSADGVKNWETIVSQPDGGGGSIGGELEKYEHLYVKNIHGPGTFSGAWTLAEGATLQATYADLAERFAADEFYDSGTVVKIGGKEEITKTTESFDTDVLGVVASNPAFMMNAQAGTDETHPYIALAGRVHVKVIGPVSKGDRIVSSNMPGYGIALAYGDEKSKRLLSPFNVIGRALENKMSSGEGKVLVIVGAK